MIMITGERDNEFRVLDIDTYTQTWKPKKKVKHSDLLIQEDLDWIHRVHGQRICLTFDLEDWYVVSGLKKSYIFYEHNLVATLDSSIYFVYKADEKLSVSIDGSYTEINKKGRIKIFDVWAVGEYYTSQYFDSKVPIPACLDITERDLGSEVNGYILAEHKQTGIKYYMHIESAYRKRIPMWYIISRDGNYERIISDKDYEVSNYMNVLTPVIRGKIKKLLTQVDTIIQEAAEYKDLDVRDKVCAEALKHSGLIAGIINKQMLHERKELIYLYKTLDVRFSIVNNSIRIYGLYMETSEQQPIYTKKLGEISLC